MRKYIILLVILSSLTLCWAAPPPDKLLALLGPPEALARAITVVVGGSTPTVDGPNAWYGPTVAGTTYESTAVICEQITCTQGGSLTKIRLHLEDKGSANIKFALYNSDGSSLLSAGGEVANATLTSEAWNEYTLPTPVTVTSSQVVMPCFRMSAEIQFYKDEAVTDTGRYLTGVTYTNFPTATISTNDSDAYHGLAVYVD